MPFLGHLRKLSSWFLIFTLLYLSIDGMYIISTAISEVPDRNVAIENIRRAVGILLMFTIVFVFALRYPSPSRFFRNSLEGFLITLIFWLILIFSFVGNSEITFYICLIYIVLNITIIFAQKIIRNKREQKGIIEKDLSDKETIPVETNV